MTKVLSVDLEPARLEARNLAMARVGYQVDAADTREKALALSREHAYAAAVFGHTVPADLRNSLAVNLKAANRKVKIIMLYQGSIGNAEIADALLSVGDPDRILDALALLLPEQRRAAAS